MSKLGPDARALLDAAADGDEPSEADEARVHSKLTARISCAAAAAAATATTVGAKSTAAAALTGSMTATAGAGTGAAVKILVATVLVASLGAAGAVALRTEAPVAMPSTRAVAAPYEPSRAISSGATEASEEPDAATPDPETPPSETPHRISAPPRASTVPVTDIPTPSSAEEIAPVPPSDSIIEEASLLRAARAALAQADAARALAHLDEHAAKFPQGALAEERRAARVFALCMGGQVDVAKAEASAFLAANPQSPLADRVRRSCAGHHEPVP